MEKIILLLLATCFSFIGNAQDGAVDLSFYPGMGANNSVRKTAIQTDGKIIIAGDFSSFNGISRNQIARLNTDGSLDTSFNPGTGANSRIHALAIQTDGKILIGGFFTNYNGTNINRIARLNIDGTLDTSFDVGTGTGIVNVIKIQTDGKAIIGGSFLSYNGITSNYIARLNTDGTLDTSFATGTGANNEVLCISIQTDEKIIIAGKFTSYNSVTRNYIARLNADGSLDTSFDPLAGTDSYPVLATAIQTDGKIIIGGGFITYNGTQCGGIARLNTNGSIDFSFFLGGYVGSAVGFGGMPVRDIAIQQDGKIICVGKFWQYHGVSKKGIARLNTNSSLDISFDPGMGPTEPGISVSQDVFTTAIQTDGKIIVGGPFTFFNSISRVRIARLNATYLGVNEQIANNNDVVIYKYNNTLHIESANNQIYSVQIHDLTGRQVYENKNVNNTELVIDNLKISEQILIVKIVDENNVVFNKKIAF